MDVSVVVFQILEEESRQKHSVLKIIVIKSFWWLSVTCSWKTQLGSYPTTSIQVLFVRHSGSDESSTQAVQHLSWLWGLQVKARRTQQNTVGSYSALCSGRRAKSNGVGCALLYIWLSRNFSFRRAMKRLLLVFRETKYQRLSCGSSRNVRVWLAIV